MSKIVVYGAGWCADCKQAKGFLDNNKIEYTYKDVDENETNKSEMLSITDGKFEIPTIDIDGKIYQNPSNAEMMDVFSIDPTKQKYRDVLIVGAGPAALSAAIYTTREDIDTVLYEKGVIGGLAAITDWVDNYPGFANGISGLDLADGLRQQAERFGAKIELGEVLGIVGGEPYKTVKTTDGDIYARSVLIATGSEYKKLGIPGESEFYGRGVHYCATCDGAFYRDKRLVVVGGGNSAVQEAIFLTKFASHIDMLVRSDKMRASEVLQHELDKYKDKITVNFNVATDEVVGTDGKVTLVKGRDSVSGDERLFETDGVFIFIGLSPNTGFLENTGITLDESGFVKTDEDLQTSVSGIFCAGDVRSGATMQIASASGEGATAALKIREYLNAART